MQGLVEALPQRPLGERGNAVGLQHQPDFSQGENLSIENTVVRFKRYVSGVRKRWKFVVSFIIAAVLIGIIATLRATPIYQATATLRIDGNGTDILNVQKTDPNAWVDEERAVNTEIEMIRSRGLAERVVKKLNLAGDNGFFEKVNLKDVGGGGTPQQIRARREAAAIGTLLGNLNVQPKKETRIVSVTFESPDPELSARIANAYVAAAVQADQERAFGTTQFAREFLENRLAQTKAKLEGSEREMIDYARRANLVDISSVRKKADDPVYPSMGISNLVSLNEAYSGAHSKRIELEAQWQQATSGSTAAKSLLFDSGAVQALIGSRAGISAEYESLSATRTPGHPEMKRLRAKLQEIDRSLNREIVNSKESIKARYEVARRQEQALSAEVSRLTTSSLDEQDRNVQLGILKREVDTNRTFYDALLQRYKEVSAASGSYSNPILLIDPAEAPGSPIRPRPLLNFTIALGLGVALSMLTIFLLEQFDDSVRSPAHLSEKLGLALIGVVPRSGTELDLKDDILDRKAQTAEAYMSVRTTLNFTTPAGSPTPLLITSTKPAEGKSSTAISTALSYARSGARVLLIDGDLRKPSLHRTLLLENAAGFSELLSNQKLMHEVVRSAFEDRLSIITSGTIPPDPVSLLSGSRLQHVLREAQKGFDMIIIDGPPVMGLADAPLIASACKAILFVVQAGGRTSQQKIALSRMAVTNTPIIGAVLTKFDSKAEGFGNEYSYAYNSKYLHKVGYG